MLTPSGIRLSSKSIWLIKHYPRNKLGMQVIDVFCICSLNLNKYQDRFVVAFQQLIKQYYKHNQKA